MKNNTPLLSRIKNKDVALFFPVMKRSKRKQPKKSKSIKIPGIRLNTGEIFLQLA